jgi:hypothetical protein
MKMKININGAHVNAARWWRPLDLRMAPLEASAARWAAQLPRLQPLLVTTFGDGATLAATGSAWGRLHATGDGAALRVASWPAGGAAASAAVSDASGCLLQEVTAALPELAGLLAHLQTAAPAEARTPPPALRSVVGVAEATEVLELLERAAADRLAVEVIVHNRAFRHAARGVVESVERVGDLVLVDCGPFDLYLDLLRLDGLRLALGAGDLPDLEGVVDGHVVVSARWLVGEERAEVDHAVQ